MKYEYFTKEFDYIKDINDFFISDESNGWEPHLMSESAYVIDDSIFGSWTIIFRREIKQEMDK